MRVNRFYKYRKIEIGIKIANTETVEKARKISMNLEQIQLL